MTCFCGRQLTCLSLALNTELADQLSAIPILALRPEFNLIGFGIEQMFSGFEYCTQNSVDQHLCEIKTPNRKTLIQRLN